MITALTITLLNLSEYLVSKMIIKERDVNIIDFITGVIYIFCILTAIFMDLKIIIKL
jgi:hypothetical protein